MTLKFTLKSHERLKSLKQVERLFKDGKDQFFYPFKVIYILEEKDANNWPLQFAVSIPKKKIKSAVKRNLLKRRTREAYRLNKLRLQNDISLTDNKISLMFIYIENDVKNYSVIEKSVVKHLNELKNIISKFSGNMSS